MAKKKKRSIDLTFWLLIVSLVVNCALYEKIMDQQTEVSMAQRLQNAAIQTAVNFKDDYKKLAQQYYEMRDYCWKLEHWNKVWRKLYEAKRR